MAERVFTEDIGRFVKGKTYDYPMQTWEQIAKSAKRALTDFTKLPGEIVDKAFPKEELEDDPTEKGRPNISGANENKSYFS